MVVTLKEIDSYTKAQSREIVQTGDVEEGFPMITQHTGQAKLE